MVVDWKSLSGSNITVFVNDIIRKAKHEVDLVGRKSLVEQHSKTELPRGLVGNAKISGELSKRKRKSNTPRKYPSKVPWIDWQKSTDRYYNSGQLGSFEGLPIAERYLKWKVKDFLIRQDEYTLHRPIRHRFRRRQIFTKEIDNRVHKYSISMSTDGIQDTIPYIGKQRHYSGYSGKINQTLKTRMYTYFTHSKSYRHVDVLQDLVHRTIILITVVLECHLSLLMLKTRV